MEAHVSSGGSGPRFELLDEGNYFNWKYRMEMQLIRKDLWGIVAGTETRPATNARAQIAWDKRAKLAAAEIALHVANSQLPHIRKTTDPAEMWRILQRVHEDAGWANRMTLMRQFVMLRMSPTEPMQEHLNRFNGLHQALKDINVEIPDMLKVTVLLASLPEDYENVITAIESHIEATATDAAGATGAAATGPDFDYVARRLLNEEKRRKLAGAVVPLEESAMLASGKHRSRRPVSEITCFGCGNKGHIQRHCPNQGEQKGDKVNDAVEDDFGF